MALNEVIQLQREMDKARGHQIFYGQFFTHPNDVRKYDSPVIMETDSHTDMIDITIAAAIRLEFSRSIPSLLTQWPI